ncbi:MAG TPA: hypothetical protein VNJ05_03255 [Sphingomicrobium sp.]|nr:hypothetical protein [Sphingomicrobium sp.]
MILVLAGIGSAAPAHAEWWEARTDHFIVYSESSSKDAKQFAEKLERYDQALRSLQNIKPSEETDWTRVTVYRTGDQSDIGRLAGGASVVGFYIPRHNGPVAFSTARAARIEKGAANADRRTELDPQTVLFHEYAHHFMYRHFSAAYPSWYREGFAEAYSTIDLKEDGSFHLGNAPQSRGSAFSSVYFNYSVQRMLQTASKPDFEDVYGRYTYGWLLTHYLTFEPSRQGQLQSYLKLINAGNEPAAAAKTAFGDLGKLESDVKRYISGTLPGALVRPSNYAPPQVTMRRLGPDEEAIIRVKMRSKVGVTRKKAADVAADARVVAARHPQSYAVQLALTEAEFDAENWDAAERAADAAIAIKPNGVEALQFMGRIYLERARHDPKQYATARSWLAKAYEADPSHPSTLYYHYLSFSQAGGAIPESAIIGLEQSFMKAPYDEELRLAVARQLLAEKDGKVARQVLAPLVHSPHESKGAKALRQVFDLIEANKVDEAYTSLVAEMAKQEEEKKTGKERD